MLRIHANTSAAGAKNYYTSADYYSQGQELVGRWRGQGAEMLGLAGDVQQRDWDALCDNKNPETGKRLTVRTQAVRRVGYDFTFSAPKSLSLLYAMTKDERLLDAFRSAVDDTMIAMEPEMKARVRLDGKDEDRVTGNMVWGEYVHLTGRPVDGVPDPQLHAHCFVFNVTKDPHEGRWKAGQFGDLKRDAPYFEAMCYSNLSRKIEELGLEVERVRGGWEIAGVGKAALDRFSRRTAQIEKKAKEKGITNAKEKDKLGAKTREKKNKNMPFHDLQSEWKARLNDDDRRALDGLTSKIGNPSLPSSPQAAKEAVDHAIEHAFARQSAVPHRMLLAAAFKKGVGKAEKAEVERAMQDRNLILIKRDDVMMATTPEVLAEETRMLDFARKGRGACERLGQETGDTYTFARAELDADQKNAVLHVLSSRDRVQVFRGIAGTGKTTMMKEAVEALEQSGLRVFTFAPSTGASRGELREHGFADADTVARLLLDEKLQERIVDAGRENRGSVLWIDEAGQLGSRDMAKLFSLAEKVNTRIILSGDRRQHGSVERGAALRLLETEAGILPCELREIKRQTGDYKALVRDLSRGRTEAAFQQLDQLGWIREVPDEDRFGMLAKEYVDTIKLGKSALVVSPTHREGEAITREIRTMLRRQGKIEQGEHTLDRLSNASFTTAQLRDPLSYREGDVLVFHQNAKGHTKGERVVVGKEQGRDEHGELLPLDQAERFQAFHADTMQLAPGDRLRITKNGQTVDRKHALHNGNMYTLKGFTEKGDLILNNDWVVSKDYGHVTHGYVVTSYASQGKSVDRVLIGQSAASFTASSREQFYVSVSRGKECATVFTNCKLSLLEAVKREEEKLTATELVRHRERERGLAIIRGGLTGPTPTTSISPTTRTTSKGPTPPRRPPSPRSPQHGAAHSDRGQEPSWPRRDEPELEVAGR